LEPVVPDTTFSDRPITGVDPPATEDAAADGRLDPTGPTAGANAADPAARAAILAAYEIAGHPGPSDLRAHDLLRRLRRDVKILDQATDCVRRDTVAYPDSALARQALLLLERARLIGLFY
jgi:hypothetical protein